MVLVSVIITTKNEAGSIKNCLVSIKNQTYQNLEIIVVDNFSTDNTVKIAKNYTDLVFSKGSERSAQRNFGAMKTKGKYFLFLDADMLISSKVISCAIGRLEQDNNLVGLYIPEIILGNSYWCKVRRFERSFYNGTLIDGVRFVRKDAFRKIGGFDVSLISAEDWDIDRRLKQIGDIKLLNMRDFEKISKKTNKINYLGNLIRQLNIISDEAVIFHNEVNFSLAKYMTKKNYYCKSLDKYIKKWGRDDADVKKQFSPVYRMFWVFVENGKWHKLLNHPDLAASMIFLKIITGFIFILRPIYK